MSLIDRSKVQPDRNLWAILREIRRRLRILERSHPGRPGSGPGQLAYWNAENEIETDENDANAGMYVPLGGIIMWSGAIADVPTGWALCDGDNGTPDLRDRFIAGAGSTYSPGDTGGAATNDLAHTHGAGTLGADSGGSHTHGSGTLATDTEAAHSHGAGTYATDTEAAHTHGPGTLSTDNHISHQHGPGTLVTDGDAHNHGVTLSTATVASAGTGISVVTGVTVNDDTHYHTMSAGQVAAGGYHDHSVDAGATGSAGSHAHDVSGTSGTGGSHAHDVTSGSTGSGGSHTHTVSGSTGSGGSSSQENRPPYYALAFIMRIG